MRDIERVNSIIDRELSFLEILTNANQRRMRIDNWLYVKEIFKKVCFDCAKAEGLIKMEDGSQK